MSGEVKVEAPEEAGSVDLTPERVLSRICDAQKQHYGNATALHLAMLDLCIDGRAALSLRAQPPAREDGAEKYAEILRTVCHHLELPQSESGPADDVTLYDRALEGLIAELRKTEAQRVEHQKARHIAEAALQAREDAQPVPFAYMESSAFTKLSEGPKDTVYGGIRLTMPGLARKKDSLTPLYTHPAPDALRAAVSDIAAERQRQVDAEGWSADRDDGYADAELAKSAAAYTLSACGFSPDAAREMWPRSWSAHWWKPTTARRDLVKAGALIVAEIERLDRQALAALQAEQKGAKS